MAMVNISGIPCLESSGVNITSTNLIFSFNPVISSNRFSGLLAIKISNAFTPPGSAVPVQFNVTGVDNSTIALTKVGGVPVTSSDITTGIYLVFFDRSNNIMQIV